MRGYTWFQSVWVQKRRGIIPIMIGIALMVFAVMAFAYGMFTNRLVGPPDFIVSSPSVDSGAIGITTFTPVELDSVGLRIGWAIGSTSILAGLAVLCLAAAKVLNRDDTLAVFSEQMSKVVAIRAALALALIGVGGVLRDVLEGRIANVLNIDNDGLSPDDDYDLWIFDVPVLAFLLLIPAVGWIWHRAQELQSDTEDIV